MLHSLALGGHSFCELQVYVFAAFKAKCPRLDYICTLACSLDWAVNMIVALCFLALANSFVQGLVFHPTQTLA